MKKTLLLIIVFISVILFGEESKDKYLDIKYAKDKLDRMLNQKTEGGLREIDLSRKLLNEGIELNKHKKYDEAIKKYKESLKYNSPPETYYNYGNTLDNIGEYERAIKAWTISIELGYDKMHLSYYNIGCAYSKLKDKTMAYEYIKMSLSQGYKNINHIKTDTDLQYLRSSADWEKLYKELIKVLNEGNLEVTNKIIYYENPGAGDKYYYYFYPENRVEFHYVYLQIDNKANYIKSGKWKVHKNIVTIIWEIQKGQKGVGESLPGCGSVCSYASYELYEKKFREVETLSLIEIKEPDKKKETGHFRIENIK